MNQLFAVTKKELRASFLSPVALIFLAAFLGSSLLIFFWGEKFFSKNVADIRPFFRYLPYLLVVLVSALTMRLWSEEARSGTLEVLLTLPMRLRDVVLGKFLAGLALVGVALTLTLPVPITVSVLGDLDWGPVLGGYIGLMLLSAAYLAIGMFVSSFTSNQIVALMFTLLSCGVLVFVGSPWLTDSLGAGSAELLRSLSATSRFESVLRGVLDLRDLVYYASLAGFFLVLNVLVLEQRRWGKGERSLARKREFVTAVALVGANLLALNIGLSPVMLARVDMTEWGEYSISGVTKDIIRGAREPVVIRGYFSDKTHPLLRPLLPRIADFLEELKAVGGVKLRTEIVDPTLDPKAEKEANKIYGIRSVPFRFASRHEDSVVNAYFSLLVRYGDQFEVMNFDDLIDVDVAGTEVQVRLRNLEYDLARSMKKAMYGFKSIESITARIPGKAALKVFLTPDKLPEEYKDVPERIKKVAQELSDRSHGKFAFEIKNPLDPASGESRESLYKKYGLKPLALSLFDGEVFYLHMVLELDGKFEALMPQGEMAEADIRREVLAALQRHSPGTLKVVGLAIGEVAQQQAYPGMPPPPQGKYSMLERKLGETYEVKHVDLGSGFVPGDVDVLLVVNPRDFGEKHLYAIDQFVMRGGATFVAAGEYAFSPSMQGGIDVLKNNTGLKELLASYGVETESALVMDEQNAAFPVPVTRDLGGFSVREIQLVRYPPFVDVRGAGLDSSNPATRAIPGVVVQWANPVRCKPGESLPKCKTLLASSENAWTVSDANVQPDFQTYPKMGFSVPEKKSAVPVAAALVGSFPSYFAKKEAPVLDSSAPTPPGAPGEPKKDEGQKKGRRGHVIERSPEGTRVVVVGSSSFLDDIVLQIASQVSDSGLASVQFTNNLVDWSVEDASLLDIRSKEQYARTLKHTEAGTQIAWEWGNYLFALLAVIGIGLITLNRRKSVRPLVELPPPPPHANLSQQHGN